MNLIGHQPWITVFVVSIYDSLYVDLGSESNLGIKIKCNEARLMKPGTLSFMLSGGYHEEAESFCVFLGDFGKHSFRKIYRIRQSV